MAPVNKPPVKNANQSFDIHFSYQIAGDMLNFIPTPEEQINRLGAMGTQYLHQKRPDLAIPFFEAQAGVRIKQIIDKPVHVWEKVEELSKWVIYFQSQKIEGVAQLYRDAETGQRVYGIIHTPGSLSMDKHVSELAAAINGSFSHRLSERAAILYSADPQVVVNTIVGDGTLSIKQKVELLGALEKKTKSKIYGHARAEQSQLSKHASQQKSASKKTKQKNQTANTEVSSSKANKSGPSVSLEKLGFTPFLLATHSGVSYYAKHTLKMSPEQVLSILREHWNDICKDFAKIESDRNGNWGPNKAVPPNYVAALLARFYLNAEARRISPNMMEVIVSKESNWKKDLISNQDMGLFQINKSSIDDMCQIDVNTHRQIRMNEVNAQMKKWGLKPFDIHLGQYYETNRKKGRGWKKLEFDTNPKSRYYQTLCSPDAVEMASWVLVRKMLDNHITCPPDKMSESQIQLVFGDYNSSKSAGVYSTDAMKRLNWVRSP